ncbi:hypothetical protein B0J12DRAFT_402369 [Macrophomina phaseolina]|uniref:Ketoreductase domain-containing protein n=1 Tax=Macrophomina phaseolina TaxID=35725 RepID=A0ABQ8GIE9_9PEZI|nr:hypothetical protein B0J12DRAFT_402369 [Macrophomina phaseolina]
MSTSPSPPLSLAGKVAIVTGGSRGIGAATALELAKRGAKVAITFVSPSSAKLADGIVSQIESLNNGAAAVKIQADMHDPSSSDKIVQETVAAFGDSIDILVNNAGVELAESPLGAITPEAYANVMDVNLRSVVFLTQAVLPRLRSPGRIINISSALARIAIPGASVYAATKAGLEALTRIWASELGAASHTVNAVAPAATLTDMMDRALQVPEIAQLTEMQKAMTPMEHRLGTAEDIALAVALVAEPASRWITGQTIQAGGGLVMT